MEIDGAKLWCVVCVEHLANPFGQTHEQRFRAITYAITGDALSFTLPHDGCMVFNWNKVLWMRAEIIGEPEEIKDEG